MRADRRRRYAETPDISRWRNREQRYGIEFGAYEAMLVQQDHLCASCADRLGKGREVHLDHDHGTGKVRGILCRPCNLALGYLRDSPDKIRGLLAYAERTCA